GFNQVAAPVDKEGSSLERSGSQPHHAEGSADVAASTRGRASDGFAAREKGSRDMATDLHNALAPRLLLVEEDADTAFLLCQTLRDQFATDCVRHCRRMDEALAVDASNIDLVLT